MTIYARPGAEGSLMSFQPRYDNYIGGEWVAPVQGRYFENPTPVTGEVFCEVARSDEADIERPWMRRTRRRPPGARPSPAERAVILNKIADRIEENLESIARRRGVGQRQAGARNAERGYPAGGGSLPVFRRGDPCPGGVAVADRRGHRGLSLPRAARRRRADHPVELPDPDGRLETRARAGRR